MGCCTRLNSALKGRYAIERELGEGGMATVYLADDLKHERKVALKVLKPELAAVVGAERFLAEIKTTANLQHPHILPLFDSGEVESFLFYVMPFVEGESLREKLDREKQLGVEDALAITQKVANALDYAHTNGVVHRDIKPGNILLSAQDEPLIADFGIALAVAQAGAGRITETGLSLGTPHYMSPEQATGDRDVDPRSDVYALGCVLYEMLAGQPPFSASTAQAVLVKILTADAPSITSERRTVPPNVGHALARALEKLPADRFTSAAEFGAALADPGFTYEARARTTVATPTAEPVAPLPQATGIDRRVFSAVTLVAATMTALAAWALLRPEPQLPVTLTSIDIGDRSFRVQGEILVSPDGRRFALSGLVAPEPIYWRNADEENFRPIRGTENAVYASFSPDGESLVFSTLGGAAVQRVALSGGAPQTLTELPVSFVGGLHWGDDGNIVFSHSGGVGLYRMPFTGGEPEPLLDPTTPVRNPRLLTGGRAVIFTDVPALSTLILDLQTDSVRVLQAGAIDAVYVETGHLLYTDVSGTLWAVAFDARQGEVVGEPVTLFDGVSRPGGPWARFTVSQNGTLVYSTGGVVGAGGGIRSQLLTVVDLEGNEEILVLSGRQFGSLKWSPDGGSVVYESIPQGESNAHIYIYDVEVGATPRQLTFEGSNVSPVFSPDGTRVVFSSRREGTLGLRDLFVKRLDDDTPAELLITLPRSQRPTQWPNDTLIVFTVGPPPLDLWTLDLSDPDSLMAEVYLDQEEDLRDIMVSPDGTLAAYSSDETGTIEVYVRSFPEAGERTLVSEGGGVFPRWSPDGNTVYYWTLFAGGESTFLAARLQREPTPMVLSRDTLFAGPYFSPASDLHPAGNQVIAGRTNVATQQEDAASAPERFIVVTNWFEELRQRMGN